MTGLDYVYLLGLSALWGSSYLFIKIADDGNLAPAEMICLRLVIATAVLLLVARLQGLRLPRSRRVWRSFAIMGTVGAAAPFFLIAWGETRITSALAAVLNATVPIATMVLAHFWTRREHLTPARIAGALIGFAGVVVLAGNVSLGGHAAALPGIIALLVASVCYGAAANFAHDAFHDVPPVLASTGQMAAGAVVMIVPAGLAAHAAHGGPALAALAAAVALALLGTVGAYLLFYRLIARVGPTRTSMSTYLLPAFAIVYGALFLHEEISVRLLVGFALILLGVTFVSGRVRRGGLRATEQTAGSGAAR